MADFRDDRNNGGNPPAADAANAQANAAWQQFINECQQCRSCNLSQTRRQVVEHNGSHDARALQASLPVANIGINCDIVLPVHMNLPHHLDYTVSPTLKQRAAGRYATSCGFLALSTAP